MIHGHVKMNLHCSTGVQLFSCMKESVDLPLPMQDLAECLALKDQQETTAEVTADNTTELSNHCVLDCFKPNN